VTLLPPPPIENHNGILVVRDDLVLGGTKRRILPHLLRGNNEFVYASPAYGYAQIALAYACREIGAIATIFTARRNVLHPRTQEAARAGATIVLVPTGYLSNVQAKAREYCHNFGATLLPFGLDCPAMVESIANMASYLPICPAEVWTVAGSGTLTRGLQAAWPQATFFAVQVGRTPNAGKARVFIAPEKFEEDAKGTRPPFPSCSNYDAKAWRFILEYASKGALFWNVAA
jgi:hypothetical protein